MRRTIPFLFLAGAVLLGGCATWYYVQPADPVAVIVARPVQGAPPLRVEFDATSSRPSTGAEIVSYAWDFGDGSLGRGPRPIHVYALAGTYTVSLTIEDSAHRTASATVTIEVKNAPPQIHDVIAVGDRHGRGTVFSPGEAITFTAIADDPDGYIRYWYWDFGDGRAASGREVAHAYYPRGCCREPTAYRVVLTVEDNAGQTASRAIEVTIRCGD